MSTTTQQPIDITQDLRPAGNVDAAVQLANRMRQLEQEILKLKVAIKLREEELERLATEDMPDVMNQLGTPMLPLSDGSAVMVKPIISGSLPSAGAIEKADADERPLLEQRLQSGLTWLRQHKAADIIKNQLKIELGKGNDKFMNKLYATVNKFFKANKLTKTVNLDISTTVNHQTLNAYLREQLGAGVDVPKETFSLFVGSRAEIVMPKLKKLSKK